LQYEDNSKQVPSNMLVPMCQTTRRPVPEDRSLRNIHRLQKFEAYTSSIRYIFFTLRTPVFQAGEYCDS
jgi:hypothetical protein